MDKIINGLKADLIEFYTDLSVYQNDYLDNDVIARMRIYYKDNNEYKINIGKIIYTVLSQKDSTPESIVGYIEGTIDAIHLLTNHKKLGK